MQNGNQRRSNRNHRQIINEITDLGITYKEISLNLGFANPDRAPDLIARVYENPNSFFNLETDVIYEPVDFDAQFLA